MPLGNSTRLRLPLPVMQAARLKGGALCQPALAGQRRHRRRLGKRPCAVAEV